MMHSKHTASQMAAGLRKMKGKHEKEKKGHARNALARMAEHPEEVAKMKKAMKRSLAARNK